MRFEANVATGRSARYWNDIEASTAHLFDRIADAVTGRGGEFVLMMDGNRRAIYQGRDTEASTASALNRLAAELADEWDIPSLDLHAVFRIDRHRNPPLRVEIARGLLARILQAAQGSQGKPLFIQIDK